MWVAFVFEDKKLIEVPINRMDSVKMSYCGDSITPEIMTGFLSEAKKHRYIDIYPECSCKHIIGKMSYSNKPLLTSAGQRQVVRIEKDGQVFWSRYENLFIGMFPTGIVYADKRKCKGGDYKRIAHLSFTTLDITVYDEGNDLMPLVMEDVEGYLEKRGQEIEISSSGQTVTLGREE